MNKKQKQPHSDTDKTADFINEMAEFLLAFYERKLREQEVNDYANKRD